MGRRGTRCKQLLYKFKEKRAYWKLKEEALDHTVQRTLFGRGYGPVARHYGMNEFNKNIYVYEHENEKHCTLKYISY